ncbi:MAG: dTMP kinase [Lysobacteraceae bacterium]
MSMRGRLISLEGGEGAGKSSVMSVLLEALREAGIDVVQTREPGGTPLGEALRHLLLDADHPDLCAESELLMMFASRAQLVREVVQPALQAGRWVVADRFTDASFAYQGGGRGQPSGRIAELERWAAGIRPDLTLLLDVPVAVGMERARGRGPSDRIETESDSFFERVRTAYRERAAADPQRFRVIDASQPLESVIADVRMVVADFIAAQQDQRGQSH